MAKLTFNDFLFSKPQKPSKVKLIFHCTVGILIVLCIVICVLILGGTFDEYLPGNKLHSISIITIPDKTDNLKPHGTINNNGDIGPELRKVMKEALR